MRFIFLFFLAVGCLLGMQVYAGTPVIPLQITLAKAEAVTYEGDPIHFNVTVQNADPTRRLPVLIPTGQAGYNKVFYFKIYDAAENRWQLRWVESREVTMSQQTLSLPTLRYLNPGEKVVFSANLNDYPRSFTQIESNHTLTSPMFAGRYKVFLVYDPTGNPLGDTLYNYYDAPVGSVIKDVPSKLAFPIYGTPSEPFMLSVRKTDKAMITFQNWMYACNRRPRTDIWEYSKDMQILRLIEVKMDSANSRFEAEIDPATKQVLRSFTWFKDHSLKEFHDWGMPPCNAPRFELKMQNPAFTAYSYTYQPDGGYVFESYDAHGLLAYSYRYMLGSSEVIYTTYKVKKGIPVAGKSEKWPIAYPFDPCTFTAKP